MICIPLSVGASECRGTRKGSHQKNAKTHKGLIKRREKENIHKFLTFTSLNGYSEACSTPKYIVFAYGMGYLLIGFLQVNMQARIIRSLMQISLAFVDIEGKGLGLAM